MKIFTSLLILCEVALLCNGECTEGVYESGVSVDEQNYIVNEHNNLRILLANGQVNGQPRAVNLKRFYWDDYLAETAQNIANTCIYAHADVSDSRWHVGQNIAQSQYSDYVQGANWTFAIYIWWDEYQIYQYPDGFSLDSGHYTQMAWDDTQFIGCGYSYYPIDAGVFQYEKFYVCNYGPGGNNGNAPYETGPSGCENLCD